jgi:hypothetical protein
VRSLENAKLAVSYSYRVVEETRDGFGDYQGGGVAGWIVLGEERRQYLTTTKDGFADDNLRNQLMAPSLPACSHSSNDSGRSAPRRCSLRSR